MLDNFNNFIWELFEARLYRVFPMFLYITATITFGVVLFSFVAATCKSRITKYISAGASITAALFLLLLSFYTLLHGAFEEVLIALILTLSAASLVATSEKLRPLRDERFKYFAALSCLLSAYDLFLEENFRPGEGWFDPVYRLIYGHGNGPIFALIFWGALLCSFATMAYLPKIKRAEFRRLIKFVLVFSSLAAIGFSVFISAEFVLILALMLFISAAILRAGSAASPRGGRFNSNLVWAYLSTGLISQVLFLIFGFGFMLHKLGWTGVGWIGFLACYLFSLGVYNLCFQMVQWLSAWNTNLPFRLPTAIETVIGRDRHAFKMSFAIIFIIVCLNGLRIYSDIVYREEADRCTCPFGRCMETAPPESFWHGLLRIRHNDPCGRPIGAP